MTVANTYTEALQLQCDILMKVVRRLDEKGYAVVVHKLNPEAKHERYPYRYFLGALNVFVRDWARHWSDGRSRRVVKRPVLVHVFPKIVPPGMPSYVEGDLEPIRQSGRLFDAQLSFTCGVPARDRYKPIHASLALISSRQKGRHGTATGVGTLKMVVKSDVVEYHGYNKDHLEILLKILDMPQHRDILRGV